MGRILGIDYGLRRTGVSVTDPEQIIVQGLDTRDSNHILEFIVEYARKENVEKIVIGYPFMEGAWGDKRFKQKLDDLIADVRKALPGIPVDLHDERYTSLQARAIMSTMKKKHRENKALLDRTSAVLILQEYLGHL
jgi:putative Holliday junction resolvase